jgi:hypothetical protein
MIAIRDYPTDISYLHLFKVEHFGFVFSYLCFTKIKVMIFGDSFFKKVICLAFIAVLSLSAIARVEKGEEFDWGPVMDAITKVESGGNARAVCGPYVGVMQISPGMVSECNAILKQRGSSKRFKLNDRFSKTKSREMFVVFMSKYNPTNNVEKAIRMWNGGARYSVRGTQKYYRKVMRHYNG